MGHVIPALREDNDSSIEARSLMDDGARADAAPGDLRQLMRWAREHFRVGSAAAVTCGEHETVDFVAMAGDLENSTPCKRTLCSAALRYRRPFLHVRPASGDVGEQTACPESCPFFCAGVPITSAEGELIGGVYVFDSQPHRFSVVDMEVLKCVAKLVRRSVVGEAEASA